MSGDGQDETHATDVADLPTPPESSTLFGFGREQIEHIFPLSLDSDLGVKAEQEYEDLGDQGMAKKYGSRLLAVERVPEIDNTPVFASKDVHSGESMQGIQSSDDDLARASAVSHQFESGDRAVGGPELEKYCEAVSELVAAENSGVDGESLTELARAAKDAGNAWKDTQPPLSSKA